MHDDSFLYECQCCEKHEEKLEEASGWLKSLLENPEDTDCLQELCCLLKTGKKEEETLLNLWVSLNNQYLSNTHRRAI